MTSWRYARRGTAGDGDVGTLLPVYTRLSDAEEAERCGGGATPVREHPSGVAGPGADGGAA
jgi:hypothetical protein